jgi:uncharacterized protein (TIGR00661 family)
MKLENINTANSNVRVLVAPLDWGLGHATRCIPIIYELLRLNFEVQIAAEGETKKLLENEFPGLAFLPLRGYKVWYSKNKSLLFFSLLIQLPKLLWRIYCEHKWLKKIVKENDISMVISDNRLGMYNSTVPGVYITHQLKIKTGNRFTEKLVQKIHYFFINKHSTCWVPDNKTENNLAGDLSHPECLPKTPVKYLGPLSRFEKDTVDKKYDYLVLISGPEPQRTIFEDLMLDELKKVSGKIMLVRGLPGNDNQLIQNNDKIEIHNHLSSAALNKAILQSGIVICRSGYTSIMDLIKLNQKAILVPTPGQTEQEYLAAYLMQKKIFFSVPQSNFSLPAAINEISNFPFAVMNVKQDEYKDVIREFIQQLFSKKKL